jgi:hypothetical protein
MELGHVFKRKCQLKRLRSPREECMCEKINDNTNKYIRFHKFMLCWNQKWKNMNIVKVRENLFPK